ncbi:MAG: hypothetical protein IGR76_10795 [Synechococcales cyanobacterium T60_A2020_003]|nr:hypothetical protein [Synechococcales cyanobacterium T60_A2020_003]
MNYVIAVLPDRIQAESAYTALEAEGLPMKQVAILGKGYQTADEFGFLEPGKQARRQARLMSFWLVPFGFIGGVAFNMSTQYDLFDWAGRLGNEVIGGIFGAIAGAMGSFFVGGGVGLSSGSGDALPYRNRLSRGKYLVVVSGAPNITNQATKILKGFNPENIQGYVDTSH